MDIKLERTSFLGLSEKYSPKENLAVTGEISTKNFTLPGYADSSAKLSLINFKGEDKNITLVNFHKDYEDKYEIRTAGKNFLVINKDNKKIYAVIEKKVPGKDKVNILTGKFGVSVVLRPDDPEFKDLKILITRGSGFSLKDKITIKIPEQPQNYNNISFEANKLIVNTADINYGDKTYSIIESYLVNERYKESNPCNISDNFKYKTYNMLVPAAGDGSRFKDISNTMGEYSKPIAPLPYKDGYIIYNTFDNFAKDGLIDQETELIRIKETSALGSASGFVYALKNDLVDLNSPLIIAMSDQFSDINVNKIKQVFEDKDAGIMLATIPMTRENPNSLAIVTLDKDYQVLDLLEKPDKENSIFKKAKYPDKVKNGLDLEGKHPGSIAFFIIHPKILQWIKQEFDDNNLEIFANPKTGEAPDLNKEIDFSNHILPAVRKKCLENPLLDDQGKSLKMYAVPVNTNWNDLGNAQAYCSTMKKIAAGEFDIPEYQRKQIRDNIVNNAVCMPEATEKFNEYCKKYNPKISGNVIITVE